MASEIIYRDPGGLGYHPVLYMVRLAAELLECEVVIPNRVRGRWQKLLSLRPRKRNGDHCLVICASPADLTSLFDVDGWRKKYGQVVAWVFDSFWVDKIGRVPRITNHFDAVFVTEQEDLTEWRRVLRAPVDWLPWGSDVLRLGSFNPQRKLDLVRVGRQPETWENDEISAADCQVRGLRFAGRPPSDDDPAKNERLLTSVFAETKFTLSFSNAINRTGYTHPKREYLTGRWTDALAAGATVAGVAPRSPSVETLLWPEALLELGTADRTEGLETIVTAARSWTPDRALLNWRMSLEHLDWRWRFERLRQALGIQAPKLEAELSQLRALVQQHTDAGQPGRLSSAALRP